MNMSEVEVYYFVQEKLRTADSNEARRRATLEAIKSRNGIAIMETRLVVDSSQLDHDGFLPDAAPVDA
jgi:hypothetical protein